MTAKLNRIQKTYLLKKEQYEIANKFANRRTEALFGHLLDSDDPADIDRYTDEESKIRNQYDCFERWQDYRNAEKSLILWGRLVVETLPVFEPHRETLRDMFAKVVKFPRIMDKLIATILSLDPSETVEWIEL